MESQLRSTTPLERCPEEAEEIQGIDHGSLRHDTADDLGATDDRDTTDCVDQTWGDRHLIRQSSRDWGKYRHALCGVSCKQD